MGFYIQMIRQSHLFDLARIRLAIIGMGYVGLPLAVEFGHHLPVICFDINKRRIDELKSGVDITLEVSPEELSSVKNLHFTTDERDLNEANCFIITVPTPIDHEKAPDLNPLRLATETIGSLLKKNDVVIYESTVYPGCTEEFCVPILEEYSGLKYNKDFFCGYSPERINPGDKEHRVHSIVKITSGSTVEALDYIDVLYSKIIKAGTFRAGSIKIAEAAKVIENTQRDINIALMNELAIIFDKLGIDTESVLLAAASKWNFIPFRPGLVGGHCIGVDPYYLTYKAEQIGYEAKMILAGRHLNDQMGTYVANKLIEIMKHEHFEIENANILIMGFTFKENCPDVRNTKVIDIIRALAGRVRKVDVYDPWVTVSEVESGYDFTPITTLQSNKYDAIILAVAHDKFKDMGSSSIRALGKSKSLIYDLKYVLKTHESDIRL